MDKQPVDHLYNGIPNNKIIDTHDNINKSEMHDAKGKDAKRKRCILNDSLCLTFGKGRIIGMEWWPGSNGGKEGFDYKGMMELFSIVIVVMVKRLRAFNIVHQKEWIILYTNLKTKFKKHYQTKPRHFS